MTPEQIRLVQGSWQKVVPIKEVAAEMFYAKLFSLDPALQRLFKGDMKKQGVKLTAMINTAVNALTQLDALVPAVQDLGRRHVAYGVRRAHYDTVAAALIWTLEQGLGGAFTPEVRQAWVATYTLLATTMKNAAAAVEAGA